MILCPDKDEAAAQGVSDLRLLGDPAAMEANSILFDVRRCQGEGCAPDLEDFIKDIQIDSWIVYKKMNFTDRQAEPTFIVQDVYDSQVLSDPLDATGNLAKVNVNQIYIRGNDITTLDQFVNLGPTFSGIFYDIFK